MSFGGMRCRRRFAAPSSGTVPELMTSLADDWLARMFLDMAAKYQISVHGRKVKESSLSFVMPNKGMRAIIRCRDDHYLHPVPPLDLARLPRAASRRPPGRCGDPLREALPREAYSDIARRWRAALEHAGAARTYRCRDLLRATVRAAQAEPAGAVRAAQGQRLPHRRRHLGSARAHLVRRARQ